MKALDVRIFIVILVAVWMIFSITVLFNRSPDIIMHRLWSHETCLELENTEECFKVYPSAFNLHKNYEYVREEDGIPASLHQFSVVLSSQASLNRLFRIRSLLMNEVPDMIKQSNISKANVFLSITVYTQNFEEDWLTLNDAIYANQTVCPDKRWCYSNFHIHMVYKEQFLPYPINFLRNIGFQYSEAKWMMLYDIDFILSSSLIEDLKNATMSKESEEKMFIVPAFEFHSKRSECTDKEAKNLKINCKHGIPSMKTDLHRAYDKKLVGIFHALRYLNLEKSGHGPTNYTHWFSTSEEYRAGHSHYYEPYVFFSRNSYLAKYSDGKLCHEGFYNRGYNKIVCYAKLKHHLKLEPLVLPNSFMIHFNEPTNKPKTYLSRMTTSKLLYAKVLRTFRQNLKK